VLELEYEEEGEGGGEFGASDGRFGTTEYGEGLMDGVCVTGIRKRRGRCACAGEVA
jgi:hypothetical protein